MISLKGKDKAEVLMRLYNNSHPVGMGIIEAEERDMTPGEARQWIDNSDQKFEYLKGRVLKVDLSGDEFNPFLYDRDNGQGAAEKALQEVL